LRFLLHCSLLGKILRYNLQMEQPTPPTLEPILPTVEITPDEAMVFARWCIYINTYRGDPQVLLDQLMHELVDVKSVSSEVFGVLMSLYTHRYPDPEESVLAYSK